MPGGRLTQQERRRIASGLAGGLSYAEIARRLGRPTSTVTREVARNGGARGYRPQQAHRATAHRAQRAPVRTATADEERDAAQDAALEEIVELAVRTGLPRMTARVHLDLLLAEDGRRTAAELVRRLRVSAASVSVSVNYLVQHGYVRRERDPRRRRDVYVVDDAAWYRSIVVSAQQTLASARASLTAAESLDPHSPVRQRLARAGAFLEQVCLDLLESADRRRGLLEGECAEGAAEVSTPVAETGVRPVPSAEG